ITIDIGAFYGCTALTTLNIRNGVQHIRDWSFFSCSYLVNVFIPASVADVGPYSFVFCGSLESITVDAASPFLCSIDGVLFNKDITTVLQYPMAKAGASYAIPSGVQVIADGSLYGTKYLSQITIPYGVREIGMQALASNYNLTAISIPNSVTVIHFKAFEFCRLTALVIPDSVLRIEDYAFIYNFPLTSVTMSSPVPPVIGIEVFDQNDPGELIHVPAASVAAYQNAPNWASYSSRIVAQ
ncbi:MAG: leucine-rich repeat domain-containing protein, partial [Candidatus Cryosericum sp.]